MIRYTLVCENEHDFDIWFRDSATCDAQLAEGEVRCPFCDSPRVAKALMAPSVVSGRAKDARRAEALSRFGQALVAAQRQGTPAAPVPAAPAAAPPAPEPPEVAPASANATPPAVPAAQPPATGDRTAVLTQLAEAITELRRHVEATCEDVGARFPEEARQMHYGEAESRPIRGHASLEDAKALHDEGIPVALLPWPHRVEN
ncbi:DUF1178 family protein [Pararhodospirillum oryzae]|uniref:Uncharacterized protein n=1 Tax=Pararhodospirillum oryzae TaxID=478448 RepID=A0A512H6I9_9PROT|nr:DUF1178 family protein [Pararhodospirillum oryzae]GEO81057.1 hypothetical protein ROR02_11880 [Pararhodospirillum oryzae]